MKNLAVLLSLLTYGCASMQADYVFSVEKELLPYYDSFIEEGINRGVDLSSVSIIMSIQEINSGAGGHSYSPNYIYKIPKIDMDKAIWEKSNKYSREYMVMHELAHALLQREHINDEHSIMYENINLSQVSYYINHRDKMLDELFN